MVYAIDGIMLTLQDCIKFCMYTASHKLTSHAFVEGWPHKSFHSPSIGNCDTAAVCMIINVNCIKPFSL